MDLTRDIECRAEQSRREQQGVKSSLKVPRLWKGLYKQSLSETELFFIWGSCRVLLWSHYFYIPPTCLVPLNNSPKNQFSSYNLIVNEKYRSYWICKILYLNQQHLSLSDFSSQREFLIDLKLLDERVSFQVSFQENRQPSGPQSRNSLILCFLV